MDKKRIDVAVGVIKKAQKVLVGQRLVKDRYYQKWEFPGGKLDKGECAKEALSRELNEELGIIVRSVKPLITLEHDYSDRQVRLFVFTVDEFDGDPQGAEGQTVQWVTPSECHHLDFLAANTPIVHSIELPSLHMVTDIKTYGIDRTLDALKSAENNNIDNFVLHLREPELTATQCAEYLTMFRAVSHSALIILNGEPGMAFELGFDGVQLNRERCLGFKRREQLPDFWVGASCHNAAELQHAQLIADFAFISPVKPTNSHPGVDILGWQGLTELVQAAKLPCYALGGMGMSDVDMAREYGAQGIAAISAIWNNAV